MRQEARARRESARSRTSAPPSSAAVQKFSGTNLSTSARPNDSSSLSDARRTIVSSFMSLLLLVEQRPKLGKILFRELRLFGQKVERGRHRAAEGLLDELSPGRSPRFDGPDGRRVLPDVADLPRRDELFLHH